MEYTTLIHPAEEGGYWPGVRAVPGCFSQREKIDEALKHTKEAIECHVVALRDKEEAITGDDGLPIGRVTVTA